MKIVSATAFYTGGGIYLLTGSLDNGNYFITNTSVLPDICIDEVDANPDDNLDEACTSEWYDAHIVDDHFGDIAMWNEIIDTASNSIVMHFDLEQFKVKEEISSVVQIPNVISKKIIESPITEKKYRLLRAGDGHMMYLADDETNELIQAWCGDEDDNDIYEYIAARELEFDAFYNVNGTRYYVTSNGIYIIRKVEAALSEIVDDVVIEKIGYHISEFYIQKFGRFYELVGVRSNYDHVISNTIKDYEGRL